MPAAEILTIGTELLLGEIVDTNTQTLARQLRDAGIDLFYTGTVGDNEGRIAEAVRHALTRSQVLLCTGGLGPTVDDVTREGIARALGVELVFHAELWEQIQERFARFKRKPSENNRRQAYLPRGARALENAVGSAPAFLVETGESVVIAMPGVPSEMSYILEHGVLPYFAQRFGSSTVIRTRVLHIGGVGESLIDEKIADLERLTNPTVGLAAHAGSVDVRLTAKAENAARAAEMLAELEAQVRRRLGDWIYGADEETLGQAVLAQLGERGQTLAVLERGLDGALTRLLAGQGSAFVINKGLETPQCRLLSEMAEKYKQAAATDLVLAVDLRSDDKQQQVEVAIAGLAEPVTLDFSYGGHSGQAKEWAASLALNLLRRELLKAQRSA